MSEFNTDIALRTPGEIHLTIRKSTLIAVVVSILLHVLILLYLHPLINIEQTPPNRNQPLSVRLISPETDAQLPAEPIQTPTPLPKVESKPKAKPKQPKQRSQPVEQQDKVISLPATEKMPDWMVPESAKVTPKRDKKPDTALPEPAPEAPTDMASYVAAQRAKRAAAQGVSPDIWQDAQTNTMTESERRDAIIQRNLQMGVNGLFQIMNISEQQAQFNFKGWTNSISSAKQEVIQVEVPPGEDIHIAVVRRMISLIRRYHQKDFNWESQRLGRVVVLSARKEDNAGLEEFLMKEFFGEAGKRFN